MPTTRVLHLSDLHFGAGGDEAIERGVPVLIEQFRPELVVASGDLSHRGRQDQLARASRFLHSLERPVLAIPGNHDIPYTFPGRSRVSRVRTPVVDGRADLLLPRPPRDRAQLRPSLAPSIGRDPRRAARACTPPVAGGAGRRIPDRRPPSPPDRRSVALPEEAGSAAEPCAGVPRPSRCGSDPRRAHPPGGRQRTPGVRDLDRRGARGRRLDRAGAGPAAAEAARRGTRRARLRDRRRLPSRLHLRVAEHGLGPHGRASVPARP
ncbi:MAG: hypothetical protein E6G60_15090 [Actinobacteria bacterium]|nr:MAG: hypothetical protein E6G60_15090 [Actinomycetota bacterium]